MNPIMYWQVICLVVTAVVVFPIAFVAIRSAHKDKMHKDGSSMETSRHS